MRLRLILEEFGPDIQHIKGEDNVVANALSRLPSTNQDQKEQCTEAQGLSSEMLAEMEHLVIDDDEAFPLNLPLVKKAQQNELKKNKKFEN